MDICIMSLCVAEYSAEEIVKIAQESSIKGIDWIGRHDKSASELRKITLDGGIEIVGHVDIPYKFVNHDKTYKDEYKQIVDYAKELGAPHLMIPAFPRDTKLSRDEDRKLWTAYYAEVLEYAKKQDIIFSIESVGLPHSCITTSSDMLEVLNALPDIALTFDNGNIATKGEDPALVYPLVKNRVTHVHFKDFLIKDAPSENEGFMRDNKYYEYAAIGEGDLNVKNMWDIVKQSGYNGWVNLESTDYSKKTTGRQAMKHFAEMMKNW